MRALLLAGLLALSATSLAGCIDAPAAVGQALTEGVEPTRLPSEPAWPAPEDALIRPGMLIHTPMRDCPTNFLFYRPDNGIIFLGTTAYCTADMPVGTVATLADETQQAVLAYNSWHTMQENGESDPDALEYNDFAVFYIDTSYSAASNPALPEVGGPIGYADFDDLDVATPLRAYVNPPAFDAPVTAPGLAPLRNAGPLDAIVGPSWHDATITGAAGKWALLAHGAPPALPGGMGGAVVTPAGEAVGILVNLGVSNSPGANGIARLDSILAYAREHASLDMELGTWDVL